MYILIVLSILLTIFTSTTANNDTIVQLPKGKIRGHILLSETGKPYYAFHEIPYAAPPIGSNRFKPPKEAKPWRGIRDATKNKVICYQRMVRFKPLNVSEDCLFINVYTPVPPGSSNKSLPVFLWVHGGGFVSESSAYEYFGPKFLMDHEIVVVTFNYRLGPFGFLTTSDDVIPANLGLKDQHLAFNWVHDNIELFGGNKSHVTLVGESAGSMAICLHLLGPWENNKVLFHAAILQSGSTLFFPKSNTAKADALRIAHELDENLSSTDSNDVLKVLLNASAFDIVATDYVTETFWPVVEMNGLFKYHMYDCLMNGNIKKIPILLGFTSEEWLYRMEEPNFKSLAVACDKDPSLLIESKFNLTDEDRKTAGNLLKDVYTNTTFEHNVGAYLRYVSDSMITPIIKQAELESKYADVYLYQFAYKGVIGTFKNISFPEGVEKVGHAEDLRYLWADITNSDLSIFSSEDQLMLHRFVKMLTNFVKFFNPTPTPDPLLQNITWEKVNPQEPHVIQYLNINSTMEMKLNPRYYQQVITVFDEYITNNDIK